jgi:hypothetical protein
MGNWFGATKLVAKSSAIRQWLQEKLLLALSMEMCIVLEIEV